MSEVCSTSILFSKLQQNKSLMQVIRIDGFFLFSWYGLAETCTDISYIPTHSILALSFHYERGSNCILKWNKNTKNSSTNSNNNKLYLSIKHIICIIYKNS